MNKSTVWFEYAGCLIAKYNIKKEELDSVKNSSNKWKLISKNKFPFPYHCLTIYIDELYGYFLIGGTEGDNTFQFKDGVVTVTAPSSEYGKIREALKAVTPEGKDFLEDTVSWVPLNPIELNTEKEKEQLQRLLDLLEEDDDVQDVYHNIVGLEPEEAEEE